MHADARTQWQLESAQACVIAERECDGICSALEEHKKAVAAADLAAMADAHELARLAVVRGPGLRHRLVAPERVELRAVNYVGEDDGPLFTRHLAFAGKRLELFSTPLRQPLGRGQADDCRRCERRR